MSKESANFPNSQRLIRSFGRIKSRKLSDHKNFLLQNLLPSYRINDSDLLSPQKKFLEIGFGFGDFLFEKAKKNPDILFLGSEPHLNGIVNLLAKLEIEPLQNLKITDLDVRVLFENFDKMNSSESAILDSAFILFPDPWPKLKHFKRRLVTAEFLDEFLAPKMKSGSRLVIATDHDSYKTWILSEVLRSKRFTWTANSKKDWQIFPDDWVITKYQKKAAQEGRTSVIFNLILND